MINFYSEQYMKIIEKIVLIISNKDWKGEINKEVIWEC